ncbi:MAG TPA: 4a-hydroxytetrahydrobiopterin dehydratase [Accumulibacter sp.]|nr:4a-hydroxytetrahydrobiopterin dehydratase [Accumulibacter sp.]HMW17495.1 4a-hydroxytetrahydrobiopterin dehydratase [Accumulibacter sp.]HMX21816.1 4a-hydroxytetrahydrobiopterin dehydratase [Accumulibacter sp.]HMY07406.1 4a-hydroxytetrahydrobiopterin dehydratase [Accumulibacter sp.]HNC19108.1 4a-hydroxytetrahydrobiopterin dehydratase [Accumulibacter sp.]
MPDDSLTQTHCQPCHDGACRLDREQVDALLTRLSGWRLAGSAAIEKEFTFTSYPATMAFVNTIAWLAEREDHHPDLEVGYNRVTVRFSTHTVDGLSRNDFICAAKIDALVRI